MAERSHRGDRKRPGRPSGRSKVCPFCKDSIDYLDYKDVPKLRKLINDRGKILPRRVTGNCAGHQRMVTVSIKRARELALLPFVSERS